MTAARLGIVHPGEMGAAVGAALRDAGCEVAWAGAGRSPATHGRADAAGLRDAGTLGSLAAHCDVLLSICPPGAARDVAAAVVDAGYAGIYVDANAIAPATACAIEKLVVDAGARFIDGGIVGPPPRRAGTTRLFLSGPAWACATVCDLFAGTTIDGVVVSDTTGDASAVKIAYASWTKGSAALLLAARRFASAAGPAAEQALLDEWDRSQPDLSARVRATREHVASKAWRWVDEMREIAAAFEALGLPGGFHDAAGRVYDDIAREESTDPGNC